MDEDSSAKFIGSLTKFLQSLCNGYVEFQRGVELVGHIYLSIDTGEKVDYILHEKVNKNDENSVSFVSNSFHAQPIDKKDKTGKKDAQTKSGSRDTEPASDDEDIMIVDPSERMPGSTNMGTVPNRGMKRLAGSGSNSRLAQYAALHSHNRSQGSSSPMSLQSKYRQQYGGPSATATNQNNQQDNINIGDVKLEQISADELLSLASQVDEGASSSQAPSEAGQPNRVRQGSHSLDSSGGQPAWIKQEAPDDSEAQGGHDTGWPRCRDGQSDSSNSGSDLYPVMMHQNPAYSSGPVFPGFSSLSGQSTGSRHSHSQLFPGMSGAADPFTSPMPGTSQSIAGMDPAVVYGDPLISRTLVDVSQQSEVLPLSPSAKKTLEMRRYRERLKRDPVRYRRYLDKQNEYAKRRQERKKRALARLYHMETS